MPSNSESIIVFAKQPQAGQVKTRLSPPLSPQQAAELSACFLADTLEMVRTLTGVQRVLACDPPEALGDYQKLAPDFEGQAQQGASLGERMQHSLEQSFNAGSLRAVLIGSDLPHLPAARLSQALAHLRQGADVVLGPSADGGYYLVGVGQPAAIFDVPMSTPEVLRQTVALVERAGLRLALLPVEFDVDTPADLERLRAHLQARPAVPAACTRAWLGRHPSRSAPNNSRSMRK